MSVCITTSGFQMLYVPPPGPPLNLTATPVSGGGATLPSAPSTLTLTNQTGPAFNSSSTQQLAWTAASAGSNPIDHYKVYDNGSVVGTSTTLTFNHTTATNSNVLSLQGAASPHYYQVSAVDSQGNEGPLTTDFVVYMYQGSNGGSTCSNHDFSFGMVSIDYADTTGAPVGGGTDVKLVYGGGWQPISDNPLCNTYGLELGGFTSGGNPAGTSGYCHFDVKPVNTDNTFRLALVSRAPPFGDIFNYIVVGDVTPYITGPTPGVMTFGSWNSVKVPLNLLSIGTTTFTASVGAPYGSDANGPWATMTVTSSAGVGVDYGGLITSPASIANARVGLQGENGNPNNVWHLQASGIITGSTVVSSQMFTCQRTNMYKLGLVLNSGGTPGNVFVNNLRYTRLGTL